MTTMHQFNNLTHVSKMRFGLRQQAERDAALGGGSGKALSPLRSSLRCASPRRTASAVQKLMPKFGEKLFLSTP
jgi:hypothetical protein